jgi:hypothetical protein
MGSSEITLVSFDIDGTLIIGDPPGQIELFTVERARALGYVIGSCSDRTISNQEELWGTHGIEVDFVCLKHRLDDIRERFSAARYVHIGDTDVDRYYARQSGFEFHHVEELPLEGTDGWIF